MAKRGPNLTLEQRNQVAQFLLVNCKNGSILYGKVKEAAQQFEITRRQVHYIWVTAKQQLSGGGPINLLSKKIGAPKKKRILLDLDRLKEVPYAKRGTIRRLAKELGLSKSYVGRLVKNGELRAHTNAIKPELTEINKVQRLKFSLNALRFDSLSNKITFSEMYHIVHIDEKWFYMSRTTERYYVLPNEEEPHRSCKSKRFIPKVMFMCAVSRPQLGFDGKIGLFPFTTKEPAKRNSKNRVKGTLVTKPIESITKEVIKGCLINQIIPAIKAKWPEHASKNIIIQQDNAKPHISNNDTEFRAAASTDGFNIILVCQPPNSPDTNINDLGWFRAIQSLQVETASYNVDDIVKNVLLSFHNLTAITLNNVFLSLQNCLVEIMKAKGHNNFKLPHMGKERLIREERLPITLEVDEELVRECIQFLVDNGHVGGPSYDIGGLMLDLGY